MRVAIIKSGGYLDSRISRVLANNNIKGDIISKVTRSTLIEYDTLIFTYQYQIPNMPKVLEQITLEKRVHVIYVSNTLSIGQFYNLFEDVFFNYIKEENVESVLPKLVEITKKYINRISRLEVQVMSVKEDLSSLKKTKKAKRILIQKGLSEEDAHRLIIDKSMTMRMSKKEIVNLIIENKIDI